MNESMTETLTDTKMLTLTSSAIAQLKKIKSEQQISDNHGLRVGVKGGGCSGFSYILGFDQPKEDDYRLGIEIDWLEGLNNRGFSFNNPNAKSTCGCGSSFAA
jgi:iron-sulfur cluster assembly protein